MKGIKTSFLTLQQLPLVVQPTHEITQEEFFNFLSSQQTFFKQKILKYGGILFRDFPIQTAEDFSHLIRHLGTGNYVDYRGGDSPKNKVKEGIYISTEASPSIKIPLHNELSFLKNYPKHIYFFCELPSSMGSTMIIADARRVYKAVHPKVKQPFIDKGLCYESYYYYKNFIRGAVNTLQGSHQSWIHIFETESKEEVEQKCHKNEFEWEWTKNDWLRVKQVRPSVMAHPQTAEIVWFNQAHLYDFNPRLLGLWRYIAAQIFPYQKHTKPHQIFFADYQPIPRENLYHIMEVLDKESLNFQWKKGDVLVLDNLLCMHGREIFKGKERILTAMTS